MTNQMYLALLNQWCKASDYNYWVCIVDVRRSLIDNVTYFEVKSWLGGGNHPHTSTMTEAAYDDVVAKYDMLPCPNPLEQVR